MARSTEEQGLISGQPVNRQRHAMTVAAAGMMGALAVIVLIWNSAPVGRSTVLVDVSKKLQTSSLSPADQSEKNLVECVVGFGAVGAMLCPTKISTHSLISKEVSSAEEVVHSLAPVAVPVDSKNADPANVPQPAVKAAKATVDAVKAVKSDAPAEVAPNADAAAVMASDEPAAPAPAPIDCACCHSKCQKSGLYKDPKMKAVSHSFWCVKKVFYFTLFGASPCS